MPTSECQKCYIPPVLGVPSSVIFLPVVDFFWPFFFYRFFIFAILKIGRFFATREKNRQILSIFTVNPIICKYVVSAHETPCRRGGGTSVIFLPVVDFFVGRFFFTGFLFSRF